MPLAVDKINLKRFNSSYLIKTKANFVFARHPRFPGEYIYSRLREKGILVRHFSDERIRDHNRITIGTLEDMKELIKSLKEITEE